MQAKVQRIEQVTAKKEHECSFTGQCIQSGEMYYAITYKLGEEFLTYKVNLFSFDMFCKTKLFIELDNDYETLRQESEKLNQRLTDLKTRFKSIPGIEEKLQKLIKV